MLRPAHRVCALALAVSVACSGCATTYYPRPGPRLSMVMVNGRYGFARDGIFHPAGTFGAGLVDAVAGNREAEQHARAYRDGNTVGFALTSTGLGAILLGTTLSFVIGLAAGPSPSAGLPDALIGEVAALLVGAGLDVAGAFVTMSAAPRLYDAINAYNDGLGPYAFELMRRVPLRVAPIAPAPVELPAVRMESAPAAGDAGTAPPAPPAPPAP